jgi:undecaprenyl-diphosphatase
VKAKIIIILALALFVSFFIDKPVAEFSQSIRTPFLDTVMLWFSSSITIAVVLIITSALFLIEERKKRYVPVLLVSFILGILISYVLKFIFMRGRPGLVGSPKNLEDYSFPSTHSTMAFSVIPVLGKEFSKVKIFWFLFSVMISLSRIYLNQHYLSDVMGGIILGYIIGYFTLRIEEKHGFAKKIFNHV